MWPRQSDVLAYRSPYGDPRGRGGGVASARWQRASLVAVPCPWTMWMGDIRITRISVHDYCAESLGRVMGKVWIRAGKKQRQIEEWHADKFGGGFNYRPMRGLSTLSMHAFGCAIDFDPENNGLGDRTPFFTSSNPLIEEFEREGWTWGGRWRSRVDAMHVQAADV